MTNINTAGNYTRFRRDKWGKPKIPNDTQRLKQGSQLGITYEMGRIKKGNETCKASTFSFWLKFALALLVFAVNISPNF